MASKRKRPAAPGKLSTQGAILRYARQVIRGEARTLEMVADRLNESFARAVELVMSCRGDVVVTGLGKTGIIGRKISATLASTGTRSHFLHPVEAIHGDLGRVAPDDLLLAISNSGETEVVTLVDLVREMGPTQVIAVTGDPKSALARRADVVLDIGKIEEVCPMVQAPTASTTAILALGDALALVLLRRRGFGPSEYARFHPGGNLGFQLRLQLTRVNDIMRTGQAHPVVPLETTVAEATLKTTLAEGRPGAVCVVDRRGKLAGLFTDSDLRRLFAGKSGREKEALWSKPIREVMTPGPRFVIETEKPASEAFRILHEHQLDELPVVDKRRRPVGIIDVQDVLALRTV